jgi:predicted Rossmann fold flavoprotein
MVVGGGAAGLIAAAAAADLGASVVMLEKMSRPGRKLRITGKGRCNITNVAELEDFIDHFGKSGRFLRQAFSRWFSHDVMKLFEDSGIKLVTERGGRVFPASGKATDVVDALVNRVESSGCRNRCSCVVDSLIIEAGKICGVKAGDRVFTAESVILATGGASYPATGSSGDGYRLAADAGHNIIDIRPALVPLEVSEKVVRDLAGLALRNIRMRVIIDGSEAEEQFGELTFENYGVSGPVVLTASGRIVDALRAGKGVVISLDLKPGLSDQKLENRLVRDFAKRGREPMSSLLRGLMPRQLVRPCLRGCKIQGHRTGSSMHAEERKKLKAWLKDFRLTITGHRPWSEAIVTAGGVDTREINPVTMESKKIKGLYIAGELLDIQADTGGYNLQAAFSTGRLAGIAAGRMGGNAEMLKC